MAAATAGAPAISVVYGVDAAADPAAVLDRAVPPQSYKNGAIGWRERRLARATRVRGAWGEGEDR